MSALHKFKSGSQKGKPYLLWWVGLQTPPVHAEWPAQSSHVGMSPSLMPQPPWWAGVWAVTSLTVSAEFPPHEGST